MSSLVEEPHRGLKDACDVAAGRRLGQLDLSSFSARHLGLSENGGLGFYGGLGFMGV